MPSVTVPAHKSQYAPLAIFVYRRTDILERVLDALEACKEFSQSDVFVFSDGPKSDASIKDVEAVRAIIRGRLRPNMTLIEAPRNKGLAHSIIEGVTQLCNEYGRAIVIEDDLIVSPVALSWFNNALYRYADEPRIMQISGHMFEVPQLAARRDGVFLPFTTSWGWAVWKRSWDQYEGAARGWEVLLSDRAEQLRFDLDGAYPYTKMLQRQMNGEIDSWAIRWYWSVFKANGLTLFPPRTLVMNIGDDESATHKGVGAPRAHEISLSNYCATLPDQVVPDLIAYKFVQKSLLKNKKMRLARLLCSSPLNILSTILSYMKKIALR